jgi:hypothetical protein
VGSIRCDLSSDHRSMPVTATATVSLVEHASPGLGQFWEESVISHGVLELAFEPAIPANTAAIQPFVLALLGPKISGNPNFSW